MNMDDLLGTVEATTIQFAVLIILQTSFIIDKLDNYLR